MFKRTSKQAENKIRWKYIWVPSINKRSIWTVVMYIFLIILGILILYGVFELLRGLLNPARPYTPTQPAPSAPQPGSPPSTGFPVICNCVCPPPVFYPPPQQTPKISTNDISSLFNKSERLRK